MNYIKFRSYRRNLNWPTERVAFIGNASYFCEPLEATAIELQCNITDKTLGIWTEQENDPGRAMSIRNESNQWYTKWTDEAECIIMMHYCAYNKIIKLNFGKKQEIALPNVYLLIKIFRNNVKILFIMIEL